MHPPSSITDYDLCSNMTLAEPLIINPTKSTGSPLQDNYYLE